MRAKEILTVLFNLDKRKRPYTKMQITGMVCIVLFIFPVIFNIFGYLALPFALLAQLVFRTENQTAIFFMKLFLLTLKLFLGLAGGIWICRLIWPGRLPLDQGGEADC